MTRLAVLPTSQRAAVIDVRPAYTNAGVTTFFDRSLRPGPAAAVLATMLLLTGCVPGAVGATHQGPGRAGTTSEAPGAAKPGAAEPGAAEPGAAKPGPEEPGSDKPSVEKPSKANSSKAKPSVDLTAHSATDPASPWVVVNKRTPLDPVDHEPELTTVRGYLVRPAAAPDLTALLAAADADGVHLTLRSAYRGYPKQAEVYAGWVAQLGAAEADAVSARPGHSEHQTGIAVDVGSSTRPECDFDPCFGDTVEGRWVAEHATEHGFLVRYTPENSAVTGYGAESWHLRWVGRDLAAYMRDAGVTTLEEVFGVPGGGYVR
jgi:D-alanyl-D-alanine carboxypeptidase